MADTKQAAAGGGIGVSGVLWIVLIVLKILGEISMSWFWVITGIIWIPCAIGIGILAIVGIVLLIIGIISSLTH
ncbi:MAG: hypothetical protein GF317_24570 [Candidatus Lokiarchaeota archaeon]|nr:hypothetical protein [Candidatus Lokiarchaeota archaeon]